MSSEIDNRVVQMNFDNKQFEQGVSETMKSLDGLKKSLKLDDAAKGFNNIDKASKNINFDHLANSVDNISSKFSALGIMGVTALQNLTNSAVNAGKKMVAAFTIDPLKDGFKEYETQINSVQTILANTEAKGTTLGQVNSALNELNTYADKTIYNFTEMTRNIGTFTAAGVDLKTSVSAIKGIANLAAMSGSTSEQASTAMYQLSQALASGRITLQDWNSVVNAGMGGQTFQNALKQTAKVMGKTVDESVSFRESINSTKGNGWLTSDVLLATLKEFTGDLSEADLKAQGFTADQIKNIIQLGNTANEAATKVKTVSQLFDTLKEAVGSGWTQTWQIIVGDFGEAKEFLTEVSNTLGNIANNSSKSRNDFLTSGLSSGWKQLLYQGISDSEAYESEIEKVAETYGVDVKSMIKKTGSFEASLKDGWMTADILKESLHNLTKKIVNMSEEERRNLGYTNDQVDALKELDSNVTKGKVNLDEFVSKMSMPSGRENLIASMKNSFEGLMSFLDPMKEAFKEIFPPANPEDLYSFTSWLDKFTEKLKLTADTSDKLRRTFKGLFAVLDIGKQVLDGMWSVVKGVVGHLFPMTKSFLDATASIGDFLVAVDAEVKKCGVLVSIFEVVQAVFETAADLIKAVATALLSAFSGLSNIDLSGFDNLGENIRKKLEPLTKLSEWVEKVWGKITAVFEKIAPFFKKVGGAIGDAIENLHFNNVMAVFNSATLLGFVLTIHKFLKEVNDNFVTFINSFKQIPNVLGEVANTLKAFQNEINSKAILKIAIAVALLAGALFVLSIVDTNKIGDSLMALGIIFGELIGTMAMLIKMTSKFEGKGGLFKLLALNRIVSELESLAIAIFILSLAVKNIGSLPIDQMYAAVGVIGILMAEMAAMNVVLTKTKSKAMRGAKSMIIVAIAVKILCDALKSIAMLKPEELKTGIVGLVSVLGTLYLFMQFAKFDKVSLKATIGILLFAAAIAIMTKSFTTLAKLKPAEIAQGFEALLGIFAILLGFTLAMNALGDSKKLFATAAAIVVLGIALKIISDSVVALGSMDPEQSTLGLMAILLLMAALTATVNLFPKDAPKVAISILAIAISLKIMADAIQSLGGMSWDEVARGLVALGGAMAILVVGINSLNGAVLGAISMLIIAAALAILVPQLVALGQLKVSEIAKGLIALALAFAVIAVAGVVLGTLAPLLLVAGVALLVFGAAMIVAGLGLKMMATAGIAGIGVLLLLAAAAIPLALLSPILVIVGLALIPFAVGLLLVGAAAMVLGTAMVTLNATVPMGVQNLYMLADAGAKIAPQALALAKAGAGLFVFGVGALVAGNGAKACSDGFIHLGEGLTAIKDAGTEGFDNVKEITGDLIIAGAKLLIASPGISAGGAALLVLGAGAAGASGGLAALNNNAGALSMSFMTAASGIKVSCSDIVNTITTMISNVDLAFQNGTPKISADATNMVNGAVNAIKTSQPRFSSAGAYCVDGFVNGLTSNTWKATAAAANMARQADAAARKAISVKSPSKKFEEIGMYADMGMAKGLTKYASLASDAAYNASESTLRPVMTMTDAVSSSRGSLNASLLNMTKNPVNVLPSVYSENDVTVRHTFDPLTIKGVNDKNEFVASADYAVEGMLSQMMRRQNRT